MATPKAILAVEKALKNRLLLKRSNEIHALLESLVIIPCNDADELALTYSKIAGCKEFLKNSGFDPSHNLSQQLWCAEESLVEHIVDNVVAEIMGPSHTARDKFNLLTQLFT